MTAETAGSLHGAEAKLRQLGVHHEGQPMMAELYRRAEARLRKGRRAKRRVAGDPQPAVDAQRMLHELQVHQVELEMQNEELKESRNRVEALLEKYTDLYDFAPVGYFSLDQQGRIREVNLTGAALLGTERSRLLHRRLEHFVVPTSRPSFLRLLEQVFADSGKQVGEAELRKKGARAFWANLNATPFMSAAEPLKGCRLAVLDITSLKQAEEAQHRVEALARANSELQIEIARRQTVEEALKESEQHQGRLLDQSRQMQRQLQHLSHRILQAQEDERKRISRELHDEIAQTLVGINVHLETLAREATVNPRQLKKKIVGTQRLVEKSVNIVHRFARELRPTALDDLGLIATLHSYMKDFMRRTGIRVEFRTFAEVEQLNSARRTVLYRVIQAALTNVAQHARATRVNVSIRKQTDIVHLEISNDGKSFDVQRALHAKGNKRLGLIGMRERVEMVEGRFAVESAPGEGTTIRAEIPFGNGGRT
jgi:PAS domain S-box-containing protein